MQASVLEDWALESGGADELSNETFADSIFELTGAAV